MESTSIKNCVDVLYSFDEIERNNDGLSKLAKGLKEVLKAIIENPDCKEIEVSPKSELSFEEAEQQGFIPMPAHRDLPVVTVDAATLDEFNQNTGNNVSEAYITPLDSDYAHELMTASILAYVLLDDVKVRRDKYKPETEEGRKLLAHELTHVAQNQNKEFVDHRTREELEEEAEANERTAESIQDPLVTRKINGKDIVLPASMWHEVSQELFRYLPQWLHYEKFILPPKEHELLTKKYEYFMKYMSHRYRW